MFLEQMKTTDFKPGKKYTFVIPTGSTEQHGPFLPLGTDSFIQDRIIEDVEKQFPEVIFLPTMRITCSEEHRDFPGSVWINLSTMNLVMKDICASLQPYAKQIIFVTAHGGNIKLLNAFVQEHQNTFADTKIEYLEMYSQAVDQKLSDLISGPVDAHAGNTETAMMMVINEKITSIPPTDYPKKVIDHPFKTNHLKDFSEDGIADNHPTWMVSREVGEKSIQWTVEEFCKQLKEKML